MGDLSVILNLLLGYAEKLINNGVVNKAIDVCVQWIDEMAIPLKDAIWLLTH